MSISSFLNHILKNKRYSLHTVKAYENDLESLKAFLEDNYEVTTDRAEADMLRSWLVQLLDTGASGKTVNRKLSTLKSYYNFLYREGLINQLPTGKLISPKIVKPLPTFVSQKDMDRLFDSLEFEQSFNGRRDALIIDLFYSCGMRLSELINIKDKDLDFYNATLKVIGKRNKERILPLHKNIIQKLKEYLEEKKTLYNRDYLFVTEKGNKLYPKFVYRKVNYYLGQVTTLKKKSPHVLRHTFATHMLNNGADLNTIKEILGHTNLTATEVYTHNSIEKLKNIYKQAHPRA